MYAFGGADEPDIMGLCDIMTEFPGGAPGEPWLGLKPGRGCRLNVY